MNESIVTSLAAPLYGASVNAANRVTLGARETPRQLYERMQRDDKSDRVPLKHFGEAWRRELQEWH